MADTPILGITQVAPNQNNKETTINDGFSIIERSLNAALTVDLSAGNAVLTVADFQRHQVFVCHGHAVARTLTINNQQRFFAVRNTGTDVVTVQTATPVATVAVPVGSYVIMYCDGAASIIKIADSAASALSPTFLNLTDTPTEYTGHAGKYPKVNVGETALEFDALSVADISDIPAPTASYYLRRSADGLSYEWVQANAGGETEFVLLNDTPANYTGSGGYLVRVNAGATALEFVNPQGALNFTNLGDAPSAYGANGGKLVAVNFAGNGLEFVPVPTVGEVQTRQVNTLFDLDFELANLNTYWTSYTDATMTVAAIEYSDGVTTLSPQGGIYFYRALSTATSTDLTTERVQDTGTLLGQFEAEELDNAARLDITFHFAQLNADTTGAVEVEYFNGSGTSLGTNTTGVLTGTLMTWTAGALAAELPLGTRSFQVKLKTTSTASTGFAFDEMVVAVTVTQAVTFDGLPDTPASFVGAAGRYVRVNSTEDAVEYHPLALTDLAPSLAGNAGRVLAVNDAETGMEWVDVADPDGLVQFVEISGTTHTLVLADLGKTLVFTNAAGCTVTIPNNTSVAHAIGSYFPIMQEGAGQVEIVGEAGVTIRVDGFARTRAQYASIAAMKRGTDTWYIEGNVEPA